MSPKWLEKLYRQIYLEQQRRLQLKVLQLHNQQRLLEGRLRTHRHLEAHCSLELQGYLHSLQDLELLVRLRHSLQVQLHKFLELAFLGSKQVKQQLQPQVTAYLETNQDNSQVLRQHQRHQERVYLVHKQDNSQAQRQHQAHQEQVFSHSKVFNSPMLHLQRRRIVFLDSQIRSNLEVHQQLQRLEHLHLARQELRYPW